MELNFQDSEDEENLLNFLIRYNFQSWNFIFESQKGSDSDVKTNFYMNDSYLSSFLS